MRIINKKFATSFLTICFLLVLSSTAYGSTFTCNCLYLNAIFWTDITVVNHVTTTAPQAKITGIYKGNGDVSDYQQVDLAISDYNTGYCCGTIGGTNGVVTKGLVYTASLFDEFNYIGLEVKFQGHGHNPLLDCCIAGLFYGN